MTRRRLKITVTRIRRARATGKTVVVPIVRDRDGSAVGAEPEVVVGETVSPEPDIQACISSLLEMAEMEKNR